MKNVAVIGAGTMGNGIAHTFAQNDYKVQLIEKYEELISASLYYSGSVTQIASGSGSVTASVSSLQERQRQQIKKDQLLQGFDGFLKLNKDFNLVSTEIESPS